MLTRWTLENFKPIRERLDLPTAPLTVLAGLNSSGKSSFLQSILLIAQTLANQKLDEPLVLNGNLVRFGTFRDVCNERAKAQEIRIGFTLDGDAKQRAPLANGTMNVRETLEPLSVSLDVLFEEVLPKEEEGHGLPAARAALNRVDMTVLSVDGPASIAITRATIDEEVGFTSGVSKESLRMLPYSHGQNYLAQQHVNGRALSDR